MDDAMPPPVGRRSAGLALGTILLAGQAPGALAQGSHGRTFRRDQRRGLGLAQQGALHGCGNYDEFGNVRYASVEQAASTAIIHDLSRGVGLKKRRMHAKCAPLSPVAHPVARTSGRAPTCTAPRVGPSHTRRLRA